MKTQAEGRKLDIRKDFLAGEDGQSPWEEVVPRFLRGQMGAKGKGSPWVRPRWGPATTSQKASQKVGFAFVFNFPEPPPSLTRNDEGCW